MLVLDIVGFCMFLVEIGSQPVRYSVYKNLKSIQQFAKKQSYKYRKTLIGRRIKRCFVSEYTVELEYIDIVISY